MRRGGCGSELLAAEGVPVCLGGCRSLRLSPPLVPGMRAVHWGSIEPLRPRGAWWRGAVGCASQRALGGESEGGILCKDVIR